MGMEGGNGKRTEPREAENAAMGARSSMDMQNLQIVGFAVFG